MTILRGTVVCLAAIIFDNSAALAADAARGFPERPVRLIVSSAPGGGADFMGRILAAKLTERKGYVMVVDNRGGAGGIVGTDLVAKATPDGYTLGLANNTSHVMGPVFNPNVPYNPVRDFTPISLISNAPQLLVAASVVPVRTVAEMKTYAAANPGKVNFASSSTGSLTHLLGESFRINTGIKAVNVAYKSSGQGLTALLAGEAQFMFVSLPAALPQIQGGRIRPLAISGTKRSAQLPSTPTLGEAGVRGFDLNPWFGALGPAHLPPAIVRKLHDDIASVMQLDETRSLLASQGAEAVGSTPEEFAAVIKQEVELWTDMAKRTGLKIN